jgi:hypothetical protein
LALVYSVIHSEEIFTASRELHFDSHHSSIQLRRQYTEEGMHTYSKDVFMDIMRASEEE